MAQEVTLGGERIGSGNKQKVELHNYGMTSFNLEQDFKSSMAPGVLYPFMKLVGTNHGTFDIDLDSFVRTLPTTGPLFGSFKLQLDVYNVPIRLYQGLLHNNPVGLGMKMNQVYLPKLAISVVDGTGATRVEGSNDFNWQINDSALMKYLGLSGIGRLADQHAVSLLTRHINAVPALAYYDIFKNYYANKQEEKAYVITPKNVRLVELETEAELISTGEPIPITDDAENGIDLTGFTTNPNATIGIKITSNTEIKLDKTYIEVYGKKDSETASIEEDIETLQVNDILSNVELSEDKKTLKIYLKINEWISPANRTDALRISIYNQSEIASKLNADIALTPFSLANIDDMRNFLLSNNELGTEVRIVGVDNSELSKNYWGTKSGTDQTGLPYTALTKFNDDYYVPWNAFVMNGLCVKTYQSDLFNNWLDSEFIDGENGISAISSVAIVNNAFTMDALNMAEKIYEYLNRVLVSGGTYEDWQEATYGEGAVRKAETPMYVGGMSAEIMFEEVINSSESDINGNMQPLGSLGGKGTMVGRKGGNNIHIKCDEPCYIIGIASITPRICYSQGNDWDMTELDTLDDLHKPALDGIGFQDLIIEQMCWWNTILTNAGSIIHRSSAGKQTAWINYQTAVDKCFGDFANDTYSYMTLNRRYEQGNSLGAVKDMTTYIDPTKYNYAFAVKNLAAQNFWVQIHSKVIARRKMGAQQIPNL